MKLPEPRYTVTDVDHKYTITERDGTKHGPLISVTTALGVLAKPALIGWAAKESAKHFKAEVLRLGARSLDAITLDAIERDAAGAHRRKAKDAADLGTACHDAFDKIVRGEEPEQIPEPLRKPVAAFKDYRLKSRVEVVATELAVGSLEHKAGGRIDWVGWDPELDGFVVGDYKTSSGFYGNEYAYQAGGGYTLMLEEQYGVRVVAVEISRFSKKEPYESEARAVTDLEASKAGFLCALSMVRINGMPLIGEPLFTSVPPAEPKEAAKPKKKAPARPF